MIKRGPQLSTNALTSLHASSNPQMPSEIFNHVSFQSNSGAMGEYSALLCIRKYHNNTRKTVIIPESAHGTNFASASLAGLKVKRFNDELFDDIDAFDKFVSKIADDLAGKKSDSS